MKFTTLTLGVALTSALSLSSLGCASDSFDPSDTSGTKDAGPDGQAGSSGSTGGGGQGAGAGQGGTSGSGATAGASGSGAAAGADAGSAKDGTPCGDGSSCSSGQCVDGVCCDTLCDADCESCTVTGSAGTCTPHAAGVDPDGDCAGSSTDCAGKCDGSGACNFPSTKVCGLSTCTADKQSDPRCDGAGNCQAVVTDCVPFACGINSCKTTCASVADCASGAFCSPSKQCELKKPNGTGCSGNDACLSGHCAGSVCCNTACSGANFSCSTGTCNCDGKVCGASETCVNWYRDKDADTYGDATVTTLGCSTSGPTLSGYVDNAQDCYDNNNQAKPGQTQYFISHRGDGSFDYDCNKAEDKQRTNFTGAATCSMCQVTPACLPLKLGYCSGSSFCASWASEGWNGFSVAACGVTADYNHCILNPQTSQPGTFKSTQTQGCR